MPTASESSTSLSFQEPNEFTRAKAPAPSPNIPFSHLQLNDWFGTAAIGDYPCKIIKAVLRGMPARFAPPSPLSWLIIEALHG